MSCLIFTTDNSTKCDTSYLQILKQKAPLLNQVKACTVSSYSQRNVGISRDSRQ